MVMAMVMGRGEKCGERKKKILWMLWMKRRKMMMMMMILLLLLILLLLILLMKMVVCVCVLDVNTKTIDYQISVSAGKYDAPMANQKTALG